MVEPAIELVVDPARSVGASEERCRADDEVLEIEDAARPLQPVVFGERGIGETEHGGGRLVEIGGADAIEKCRKPVHLGREHRVESQAIARLDPIRDRRSSRQPVFLQDEIKPRIQCAHRRPMSRRTVLAVRRRRGPVIRATRGKQIDEPSCIRGGHRRIADNFLAEVIGILVAGETESAPQIGNRILQRPDAGARDPRADRVALVDEFGEALLVHAVADQGQHQP